MSELDELSRGDTQIGLRHFIRAEREGRETRTPEQAQALCSEILGDAIISSENHRKNNGKGEGIFAGMPDERTAIITAAANISEQGPEVVLQLMMRQLHSIVKKRAEAEGSAVMSIPEMVAAWKRTKGGHTEAQCRELLSSWTAEARRALDKNDRSGDPTMFDMSDAEPDAIIKISEQSHLTYKARTQKVMDLLEKMVRRKRGQLRESHTKAQDEIKVLDQQIKAREILVRLVDRCVQLEETGFVLESNDCARAHKVFEAVKNSKAFDVLEGTSQGPVELKLVNADPRNGLNFVSFVVKHDWAGVLGESSGDTEGEVLYPSDKTAFELRISGLNVVVICIKSESGFTGDSGQVFKPGQYKACFVEQDDYWFCFEPGFKLSQFAGRQCDAACIVLEAQVATHEVVRAPAALNKKRIKAGKLPLSDYHVIDLNRRKARSTPDPDSVGTGGKKRLHFCRSHWRHLKDRPPIRIPWCLKGDPALGFVDKHYSL